MSHDIALSVADHKVSYAGEGHAYAVSSSVEHYTVTATFDEEWDGFTIYAYFENSNVDGAVGPLAYADEMAVPWEVLATQGDLRVTFKGVSSDGVQVVTTCHMRHGIRVNPSGAMEGSEAREATKDLLTEAQEALATMESEYEADHAQAESDHEASTAATGAATAAASTASTAATKAGNSAARAESAANYASSMAAEAEQAASSALDAADTTTAAVSAAKTATASANLAADNANESGGYAEEAAQLANVATANANNAATNIAERVAAGEFNGKAFKFDYIVASIAAMNELTGMSKGDFCLINTGDVEQEDNSKFYCYDGSSWQYQDDLSGAAGIQGPQGKQGIGYSDLSLTDEGYLLTRVNDPAQGTTETLEVGDLGSIVESAVTTEIATQYVVVDALPEMLTAGLIYMVRE